MGEVAGRRIRSAGPLAPFSMYTQKSEFLREIMDKERRALEDFQQEFECRFVDESYSFYPFELILPCTSDALLLCDDFTDVPHPEGRIVAGFDVGRTRDRSELAVFEDACASHGPAGSGANTGGRG